jgi:hypothetical protein
MANFQRFPATISSPTNHAIRSSINKRLSLEAGKSNDQSAAQQKAAQREHRENVINSIISI